jgi:hypothetical protein
VKVRSIPFRTDDNWLVRNNIFEFQPSGGFIKGGIRKAANTKPCKIDCVARRESVDHICSPRRSRQLEQPMQGSHPEGTDASALTHMLNGHATLESGRGLFLDETWRLHPEICAFTSELFYESRLHSKPDLELQVVKGVSRINGSGLRFLPRATQRQSEFFSGGSRRDQRPRR